MKSTKISWIITTGLFSGLSPVSPGTVGSAAAVLAWHYGVTHYPFVVFNQLYIIIAMCIVGLIAIHFDLKGSDDTDPQRIVIDEWVGMWIPLLLVTPNSLLEIFVAFVAFRFFDITKPEPVRMLEKLPGAWGVMADDVAAGAYAYIFVWIAKHYIIFGA